MDLFVYGTLLIPEIRRALLNRSLEFRKAVLKDYTITKFFKSDQEIEYPILKHSPDQQSSGLLLKDISDKELEIISNYEGDEFQIQTVNVFVNNCQTRARVFMYKFPEEIRYGEFWDMDIFIKHYLNDYVQFYIPKMLSELK